MKHWVNATSSLILAACSLHASSAQTREAESAAQSWLALVDAGDYGKSWNEAARNFRDSIAQADWVSRVSARRASLGAANARQEFSARFTRSLPGAPDGEYVVIQFRTSFEHKAAATETVTPMRDTDGIWRVSGYYIR
jgi:Protein of unknown function (DUF4019)